MYACLAVTCHLQFWQNDRDFLRATVVTRGWNGYRNKSQHRKSTLEKKIFPPFQQGFEPATFQSRVRCSNHWAIPAPSDCDWLMIAYIALFSVRSLAEQTHGCARMWCYMSDWLFIARFWKRSRTDVTACTRETVASNPTGCLLQSKKLKTKSGYFRKIESTEYAKGR